MNSHCLAKLAPSPKRSVVIQQKLRAAVRQFALLVGKSYQAYAKLCFAGRHLQTLAKMLFHYSLVVEK